VDGARSSIVRIDGLENIRRLPESVLHLTAEHLLEAQTFFVNAEALRQKEKGNGVLKVPIRPEPPCVDGLLEDWTDAEWAQIDRSGTAAYFDSKNKPYDVRGALAISGDRLFAAFRVGDADLLRNSGESPTALFKTAALSTDAGRERRGGSQAGKARARGPATRGDARQWTNGGHALSRRRPRDHTTNAVQLSVAHRHVG